MKSPHYVWLALVASMSAFGQEPPPLTEAAEIPAIPATGGIQQPPEKLDQLLGPVALYPDALVALILPASTVPSDIVLAARYLKDGGDPEKVEDQSWDDSVKALARYPDVIAWMDTNLAWTKQMGEAFLAQPADVMNSVQRLRKKARETGALVDTPQQKVVVEDENIVIVPADPEVIYVPYYDPEVVYVQRVRYVSDPWVSFGIGYSTGFWLGYGLDWHYRRVWCVAPSYRERYWRERHSPYYRHYHNVGVPRRPDYRHDPHYQPWRPRPGYPRPHRPEGNHVNRPPREISRPAPFPRDVHRSTVSGNTDLRSPVEGSAARQYPRNPPHRSTAASTVVPNQSPQVNMPASDVDRVPRSSSGGRPPRSERNRPPRNEPGVSVPEAVSRPEVSPRPAPAPRVERERERVGPPPTGRTGLPSAAPRAERERPTPAPAPMQVERSQNFTPRSAPPPVREQRVQRDKSNDDNRSNPEREAR